MRPLSELHAVVPAGIDDPALPSGGNAYDRRVLDGLRARGWRSVEHVVPGRWPRPDEAALAHLAGVVAGVPADGLLLVDGLIASAADGVLVPEAARVPLVVIVHLPLGLTDPVAAAGERRVLDAASAVVTTSGWTRQWLLDTYALAPSAVHVAWPGADVGPVSRGTETGGRLLCVAAVTAHKGHADLVEALALVADRSWSCVVAGSLAREPALVAGLRSRIEEAGLTERVELVGALGRADLERAYAACDLVVLPSRLETYGMVLTEALARGIPVDATAVGGVAEAVGVADGGLPGLLVEPGRPPALAAALASWLGDEDLRERLRDRARRRREALSPWCRTVDRVWAVLAAARGG